MFVFVGCETSVEKDLNRFWTDLLDFSPQATEEMECPFGAEISQIVSNQTNKKDWNFTSFFNELEICRRPTDRREVIYRITRIVLSKVASDWTNLTNILFQSKILQFVLFAPPLGGWWFNYSVKTCFFAFYLHVSFSFLIFVIFPDRLKLVRLWGRFTCRL